MSDAFFNCFGVNNLLMRIRVKPANRIRARCSFAFSPPFLGKAGYPLPLPSADQTHRKSRLLESENNRLRLSNYPSFDKCIDAKIFAPYIE